MTEHEKALLHEKIYSSRLKEECVRLRRVNVELLHEIQQLEDELMATEHELSVYMDSREYWLQMYAEVTDSLEDN